MFYTLVIGIKERKSFIENICKKIKVDKIVLDKTKQGPLHSVIVALSEVCLINDDYFIILQDDALPCNNFLQICEKITRSHPKSVVGLFPYDFLDKEVKPVNNNCPYYDLGILSGVCVIFPAIYREKYLEFAKKSETPMQDDLTLYNFCQQENIEMIQTVPAVVQHIGAESFLNKGASERKSDYFDENPIANWESREVVRLKYHSTFERKLNENLERSQKYLRSLTKSK